MCPSRDEFNHQVSIDYDAVEDESVSVSLLNQAAEQQALSDIQEEENVLPELRDYLNRYNEIVNNKIKPLSPRWFSDKFGGIVTFFAMMPQGFQGALLVYDLIKNKEQLEKLRPGNAPISIFVDITAFLGKLFLVRSYNKNTFEYLDKFIIEQASVWNPYQFNKYTPFKMINHILSIWISFVFGSLAYNAINGVHGDGMDDINGIVDILDQDFHTRVTDAISLVMKKTAYFWLSCATLANLTGFPFIHMGFANFINSYYQKYVLRFYYYFKADLFHYDSEVIKEYRNQNILKQEWHANVKYLKNEYIKNYTAIDFKKAFTHALIASIISEKISGKYKKIIDDANINLQEIVLELTDILLKKEENASAEINDKISLKILANSDDFLGQDEELVKEIMSAINLLVLKNDYVLNFDYIWSLIHSPHETVHFTNINAEASHSVVKNFGIIHQLYLSNNYLLQKFEKNIAINHAKQKKSDVAEHVDEAETVREITEKLVISLMKKAHIHLNVFMNMIDNKYLAHYLALTIKELDLSHEQVLPLKPSRAQNIITPMMGLGLSALGAYGLYNFKAMSQIALENNYRFLYNEDTNDIFNYMSFFSMCCLAIDSITAVTTRFFNYTFDAINSRNEELHIIPTSEMAFLHIFTLIVCVTGGTPNAFQSYIINDPVAMILLALFASFIIEESGFLNLIMKWSLHRNDDMGLTDQVLNKIFKRNLVNEYCLKPRLTIVEKILSTESEVNHISEVLEKNIANRFSVQQPVVSSNARAASRFGLLSSENEFKENDLRERLLDNDASTRVNLARSEF